MMPGQTEELDRLSLTVLLTIGSVHTGSAVPFHHVGDEVEHEPPSG